MLTVLSWAKNNLVLGGLRKGPAADVDRLTVMSGDDLMVIPGESPRIAVIIRVDPLEVRWQETGERETLDRWPLGCRRVVSGTLAHRVLVERSRVESDLGNTVTSTELVVTLLSEIGQPLTAAEIKRRLLDPKGSYCLPKELVDRGLKGLPQRLRSHPSVQVSQEATASRGKTTIVPRFAFKLAQHAGQQPAAAGADRVNVKFKGDSSTPDKHLSGRPTEFSGVPDRQGALTDPVIGPAGEVHEVAEVDTSQERAADRESSGAIEAHGDPLAASPQRSDGAAPDLLAFLDGEVLPGRLDLADLPVDKTANRVGALDDKAAAAVRSRLEEAGRRDLAVVLLAMPRPSKPVAALVRDWPDEPGADVELVNGLRWLQSSSASLARVIDLLADRRIPPSEAMTAFAVSALNSTRPELNPALLRFINKAPLPALTKALRKTDVESLVRLVSREPLAARARILWAVARIRPGAVHSLDAWGRQVSLEDLIALCARTPEDALLSDTWVREEILRPRVGIVLRAVSNRQDLGRILSWPNSVFALVPSQQLATAVRRVSESDPEIRSVVEAMTGRQELDRLRARLVDAELGAGRALQEAEDAREAEQLARAAEDRWFHRAAQAEREQVAASQAELRLARIDGIRSLVEVLVLGGRLDSRLTLGEGLERMRAEASRFGVSPIGVKGSLDRFLASRHELLGGEHAEMVEVREPGYEFAAPDGAVVLRRAVVVRSDGKAVEVEDA